MGRRPPARGGSVTSGRGGGPVEELAATWLAPGATTPPPPRPARGPGRPPGPLSPEYQEVLALYGAVSNTEIAARLGKSRAWVGAAVQHLRRTGVIARDAAAAPREVTWAGQVGPVRLSAADLEAIRDSGEEPSAYVRSAIATRRAIERDAAAARLPFDEYREQLARAPRALDRIVCLLADDHDAGRHTSREAAIWTLAIGEPTPGAVARVGRAIRGWRRAQRRSGGVP